MPVNRQSGDFAVLYGRYRQVVAADNTIAPGPDAINGRRSFVIDDNSTVFEGKAQQFIAQFVIGEPLPDSLENDIGLESECLAGLFESAVLIQLASSKLNRDRTTGVSVQSSRNCPVMNPYAVCLCEFLFKRTCAHLFRSASVHDVDVLGTQPLALNCNINRRRLRRHADQPEARSCHLPGAG